MLKWLLLNVGLVLFTACLNTAPPTAFPTAVSTATSEPAATATRRNPTTILPLPTETSPTSGSERVLARIPLTWKPTLLASGEGYLWIVSRTEQTIARLDPKTNQLVGAPVRLSEPIYDIVVGEGGVWVTGDTVVTRVDPKTLQVTASLRADGFGDGTPFRLAVGNGFIWVVNLIEAQNGSHVHRIDPHSNRFVGEPLTVGVESLGIAFGAGALWSADHDDETISRVDPESGQRVATIHLPSEPHYVYFNPDDGLVWVANYHTNSVSRIDPRTNRLVAEPRRGELVSRVPFKPEWMTSGGGKVWVLPSPMIEEHLQNVKDIAEFIATAPGEPKITPVEGLPMDAEWSDGALWVTVQSPNMLLKLEP